MIYIIWTCANKTEAKQIIRGLLDKRLIACASIPLVIQKLVFAASTFPRNDPPHSCLASRQWSFAPENHFEESPCQNQLLNYSRYIFPVESIYRWKGNIEEGSEIKVLLKTLSKHFEAIQSYIKEDSSYEVPEIVQFEIRQGHKDYLAWVDGEVSS